MSTLYFRGKVKDRWRRREEGGGRRDAERKHERREPHERERDV